MLVLHVSTDGEWEEIYYGPFDQVKAASRRSERDNKNMIAISKLRALKMAIDAQVVGIDVIPPAVTQKTPSRHPK